jgi:hypothetical protein
MICIGTYRHQAREEHELGDFDSSYGHSRKFRRIAQSYDPDFPIGDPPAKAQDAQFDFPSGDIFLGVFARDLFLCAWW